MSEDLVSRAHRLYELESDYLRRLLAQDPTFSQLVSRLESLEARVARAAGDPELAAALTEARQIVLEMAREQAFKMGYLYAHTYPLDKVWKP
jgi:uncharacterized protein YdcH (DUF465 family)